MHLIIEWVGRCSKDKVFMYAEVNGRACFFGAAERKQFAIIN